MPLTLPPVAPVSATTRVTPRDAVIYALSVGATELDHVWEARGPRVLPTILTPLAFTAEAPLRVALGGTPAGALFGESHLTVHADLPVDTPLTTLSAVDGVYDLGAMAVVALRTTFTGPAGPLGEVRTTLWYTQDGGFGGPRPPRQPRALPPQGPPERTILVPTLPIQALLFRLNGDLNPLHLDPDHAPALTGGRPILHGLGTFGLIGLAVTRLGAPLRALSCRYARPVWPGDTLRVEAWRAPTGLTLRATTVERPEEEVVSQGFATVAAID